MMTPMFGSAAVQAEHRSAAHAVERLEHDVAVLGEEGADAGFLRA